MAETEERVDQYKTEYEVGLISEEERHAKIVGRLEPGFL